MWELGLEGRGDEQVLQVDDGILTGVGEKCGEWLKCEEPVKGREQERGLDRDGLYIISWRGIQHRDGVCIVPPCRAPRSP